MTKTATKRTEAPEVRRAQILDAAKRCFREAGFHATKIADIAQAAGISVGLVYRQFENKDALVEAIILEDIELQTRHFAALLDAYPDDPVAAIRNVAESFAPSVLDFDRTALVMEISAEMVRNPRVRALAAEAHEKVADLFRERLARIDPNGVSAEELEVRLQMLGALAGGVAVQLYKGSHRPSPLMFEVMGKIAREIIAPAS